MNDEVRTFCFHFIVHRSYFIVIFWNSRRRAACNGAEKSFTREVSTSMSRKQLLIVLSLVAAVVFASVALAQVPSTHTAQGEGARAFSMAFGGDNFLGVYTENITRENASRYGLSGEPRGVGITEVVENSPAAKAGLQKNDVILTFDGEQVSSTQKFQRLINESTPEHTARLTIARGGSERELTATLAKHDALGAGMNALRMENGELFRWDGKEWQKESREEWRKQSEEMRKQTEQLRDQLQKLRPLQQGMSPDAERHLREELEKMQGQGGNFALAFSAGRRIGVTTTPLTDQLADYFGVSREGGVLVTSVTENSPAAKAGLKAGDIITEVDGERIKSAGDVTRLVSRKDEGDVTLTITRERNRRTFKVTPEKSPAPTTWTTPEGLFNVPGALALPDEGFAVRPSIITSPRLRALPVLPRGVVPATPLMRVRPIKSIVPARGQLMEF
jgi:membrane-associated protease RseP (regulator of RpoE activity)